MGFTKPEVQCQIFTDDEAKALVKNVLNDVYIKFADKNYDEWELKKIRHCIKWAERRHNVPSIFGEEKQ